ncbi:uncharacterized protein LOC128740764 [Sabethes cyaneus]|uniref:uncharacterized protein LOC128740764 n=1 Tax=Sabethes cyaneus TaxID=53552 RepID=UPI00237E9035|nr:uncharacterized protein LOC128740764 [Sabethes cyaneus]
MCDSSIVFEGKKLKLSVSKFGVLTCPKTRETFEFQKFTWTTTNRLTFEVITLDAAIVSLRVPDRNFKPDEVLLASSETLKAYLYYAEANMTSSIQSAPLKRSNEWSQRIWSSYVIGPDLILTKVVLGECINLMIQVRFSVTFNNEIRIVYHVASDRVRSLETSHRIMLNLGGHCSAHLGTYDHVAQLNADGFYRLSGNKAIDNVKKCMASDVADLRVAQHVGMAVYRSESNGFDGVYELPKLENSQFDMRLIQARNGRAMEIYSNFKWMQFSTLNNLPDPNQNIKPFYACLGIRNIEDIFNIQQLINSVVYEVEGDDLIITENSTIFSKDSDTLNESKMNIFIDEVLLQDLEERIQALKEAGILSIADAHDIIIDLLYMSLDLGSESSVSSYGLEEEEIRKIIHDLMLKALPSPTISFSETLDTSTMEKISNVSSEETEPEEVLNEYQKHSGILLQLSNIPFLKKCKQRSMFSSSFNYRATPQLVYNRNVTMKFGICKKSFPNNNKSSSTT